MAFLHKYYIRMAIPALCSGSKWWYISRECLIKNQGNIDTQTTVSHWSEHSSNSWHSCMTRNIIFILGWHSSSLYNSSKWPTWSRGMLTKAPNTNRFVSQYKIFILVLLAANAWLKMAFQHEHYISVVKFHLAFLQRYSDFDNHIFYRNSILKDQIYLL